jgi:hypothetical protein
MADKENTLYPLPLYTRVKIDDWIRQEINAGRLRRNWDGSIQGDRDTSFLDKRAFEKHELS